MDMNPKVSYIPYYASSKEQTGDIITFTQFEVGNLRLESCNGTESGDKKKLLESHKGTESVTNMITIQLFLH